MKNLHSDLHMLIKARRLLIANKVDNERVSRITTMIGETLDLIIQGGIK